MTTAYTAGRHHGGPQRATKAETGPHPPVTDPEPIPHGHGQARPRRSSDTERRNRTSSVDGSSPRQNGIPACVELRRARFSSRQRNPSSAQRLVGPAVCVLHGDVTVLYEQDRDELELDPSVGGVVGEPVTTNDTGLVGPLTE